MALKSSINVEWPLSSINRQSSSGFGRAKAWPALSAFSLGTLRLLASEYSKWLVVEFGLTGWAHLREIA